MSNAKRAERPSSKNIPTPLVNLFGDQLIPWVQQQGAGHLLVAQPTLREFLRVNHPLPSGVETSQRATPGRRLMVRGPRLHGNKSSSTAIWPAEKLLTTRLPTLIYVVAGHLDFRIGDYCLHGSRGVFCLLPPQTPRSDGSKSHLEGENLQRGHCDLLWLRPSEGGLDCWLCHSRGAKHWSQAVGETTFVLHREATSYFMTLAQEAQNRAPGWEKICHGLLLALLTLLQREMHAGRGSSMSRTGSTDSQETPTAASAWEPIAYARQYIRLHLKEPLTIDRVARVACMARTQFTTRFREETGQSFTEFTSHCRLEEAKVLLRDTDWTVQTVASLIGVTPSHLRGMFLRHIGLSPREYQRRCREQASRKAKTPSP